MFYCVSKSNSVALEPYARIEDDEYEVFDALENHGYDVLYDNFETLDFCISFGEYSFVYLDVKGRAFAFATTKFHLEFEDILTAAGKDFYWCKI